MYVEVEVAKNLNHQAPQLWVKLSEDADRLQLHHSFDGKIRQRRIDEPDRRRSNGKVAQYLVDR